MNASEYEGLKTVLLYAPGAEMGGIAKPRLVQHVGRIDAPALRRECRAAAAAFRRLGVEVLRIPHDATKRNLVFVRDLFFMTPRGAVVSRMWGTVRPGEERNAARALQAAGVPILAEIRRPGTFEGADALWLDSKTVVVGVGRRTNAAGFRQLARTLRAQGVRAVAVPMPRHGSLHLLGIVQRVDRRLALVRTELAPKKLLSLLARKSVRVVPVPETLEVVDGHGMNVVTVAPRRVLMPARCPGLRVLYERAGLKVAAELDIQQLARAGGGLACATGIVARRGRR